MCEKKDKKGFLDSWFFLILIISVMVLFRILFYSPYHIPSGSMRPTLLEGDYIFVSKASYGYSRYTLPFSVNLFSGRKFFTPPERGDVVVFRPPHIDRRDDYIKRLIGLPGDKIQVINSKLYINSEMVKRERVEDYETEVGRKIGQYRETLENGVSYLTLDVAFTKSDNTDIFTVPEGYYFVMGDNRDESMDSRDPRVGFIPAENLIGRADVIAVSSSKSLLRFWEWFSTVRKDRFWKKM